MRLFCNRFRRPNEPSDEDSRGSHPDDNYSMSRNMSASGNLDHTLDFITITTLTRKNFPNDTNIDRLVPCLNAPVPPPTTVRPNRVTRTKKNVRLTPQTRRLHLRVVEPMDFLETEMRFDRSGVCRDSRRRTAIRLEKKRIQNAEESDSEEETFGKRVHFLREERTTRKRSRFPPMAIIAESRRTSITPSIGNLEKSPTTLFSRFRVDSSGTVDFDSRLVSSDDPHSENGNYRRIHADEAKIGGPGIAYPNSEKGMEQSAPDAAEGNVSADQFDRDPMADGLILPETTQSRDMKIFKRILRDPVLREPFQTFLEAQFCAENINFYLAVEQFRDLVINKESTYQDRSSLAIKIFERHFAPNSMEPVNVDNSTSKRIRQTMKEKIYPQWTFDIAQYQIFHLLKYDCWPRFLRAGGQQPEFTDDELAEEDERIARLELLEDISDLQTPRTVVDPDKPCPSTTVAHTAPEAKKLNEKEKRRSLLWQSFDRFSRKIRGEFSSSSQVTSPVTPRHPSVHRTSSSSGCTYLENQQQPLRAIGSAGTKRRQIFASGKQLSMPAEITNSTIQRQHITKAEPKHCRLMTGENCSTEVIELTDPTISVRAWTQQMAGTLGMDKKAVEVVDAETGSTIDPARQAMDALQSRSVRIVPVVTFAVEILPPNFSFKNPSSTPTKIIMVRARHSLSAGGVLRPLLSKYSIDFAAVVVTFCGTLETIRSSISIGNIGPRTLTVMSQAQYNDRTSKKDLPLQRDPMACSPNLAAEHNLQFHQHGDVSYCELPSEADRLKHQQKDHTLSLMKFVRKASAAVSNKDDSTTRHKSSGRRKSVGQSGAAGVYCGEEQIPEPPKDSSKKRLSIFKKNKEKMESQTACSVQSAAKESPRPQARDPCCSFSAVSSPKITVVKTPVSPHTSNGDAPPRTPAIFTSRICAADEDDNSSAKDHGWQPAAYV